MHKYCIVLQILLHTTTIHKFDDLSYRFAEAFIRQNCPLEDNVFTNDPDTYFDWPLNDLLVYKP